MPILFQLNSTVNWGSIGKIAEQIGKQAQSHGWDVYIAYGRREMPSCLHTIHIGNKLSPYFHYAENRIWDHEGWGSRIETKRLVKIIRDIHPDIVQLHNIHDHWLNYKILFEYLNQTDIKVVWTFHDCWAFTGHCYHFVEADCMKWQTQCGRCPMKDYIRDGSAQNYLLKKSLFQECKNLTIVSCSNWMRSFVEKSFLRDKRIQVIHNGVDLKVFKPMAFSRTGNKFHILAVSNIWNKSKGLYDIYRLRGMLPTETYEMMIVGLKANQVKELPHGIQGIQRTSNMQELAELYAQSDVLINPTYADTFPTVNLEALACGTPVITYRTGGSPEAVDEQTGVVIPQGDVEALAKAIQQMREHPLSREACRKRAEKLFDKDTCFEYYTKLYDSLLLG
jgi:glycosyltransferase involved in cell wall biosynthesis